VKIRFVSVFLFMLAMVGSGIAQAQKPTGKGEGLRVMNTQEQIETLLRNFLAGVETPAAHDRFWSDDLIYTGASGTRRSKAEIMKSVTEGASGPADPKEPKTTYRAEEVTVKDYGDFAVVNFHLIAQTEKDGKPEILNFRNTGTLRKENQLWKVVAWQATKIEPPKESK
jgi:ketosteroid isomerase-like protein